MLVDQVFQAWLFPDPLTALNDKNHPYEEGENITSGIINVNIVEGNDVYEGPYQQIDTGQFTIITRNPAMDPKINLNLKYNSTIKFYDTRSGEFFRGYVTNIDVEYQREDDPIITITGTDIFGVMQRTVVNQELHDEIVELSTGPTWNGVTFLEFVNLTEFISLFSSKYLNVDNISPGNYPASQGFEFYVASKEGIEGLNTSIVPERFLLGFSPAKYIPEVGESLLDIINKYAVTNINSIYSQGDFGYDFINVFPFVKYNGFYWPLVLDPQVEFTTYNFSSDPADERPYKTILIDNGYNRVTNQLNISNEYKYVDNGEIESVVQDFIIMSSESIEDYAVTQASVSTIFPEIHDGQLPTSDLVNRFAINVFQVVGSPSDEIQRITFDNARYVDIDNETSYSGYVVNNFIRIKHQIDETETIDRFYNIAGITHNISPDEWEMGFTFKPSDQEIAFYYQGQVPTLQMNSLSGDTNFNFTATITDYPIEDITSVIWDFNQIDANEVAYYYRSATTGEKFKNGVTRTGLTQTWNFDDDGILAPYSFDSVNIPPVDNRYGGFGPGNWYVTAYIRLQNRFHIVVQQEIIVGVPEVTANFGAVQNLIDNFGQVNFINTSTNHETGEEDSYAWDFGDGTTSALENPVHVYEPAPNETQYDVSLTVFAFGAGGVKVYNTYTETITLVQPEMTADFTFVVDAQVVAFTNTSINVGYEESDAYFWEFDDGTTSTLKNPVHTFAVPDVNAPQNFSVKLTTKNIWEQTANVTKTVGTTALNESGTFPVRYIKFSIDPYQKAGTVPAGGYYMSVTPVMSVLKALTSGTLSNLAFLKPTVGFNDNSIPKLFWLSTSGGNVQESLGWEYLLTRNIQTNASSYGLGAASKSPFSSDSYPTLRWELVVDIGTNTQLIKNIILRFQDLIDADLPGQILTEDFYRKINIEFANTVTDYTPNPAGTFGPATLNGNWINVGYIKLDGGRMDPTQPAGQRTEATKQIFKMRPLPLNIPYFNYTFNDKIVSFTSVETADAYAWTFGDGTTSTLEDPVKTYASYGTYTVSLAVTNNGVVTRTTTEPVIVQPIVI